MHAGHVGKLHQPVGGQHAVGRRLAKETEAATGHLKSGQALVAEVDVLLGLHLHLGAGLAGALEIVENQHVGVGGAAGLLEAAKGHAQQRVQPFDYLAENAGIQLHINLARAGDGLGRDCDRLFHVLTQSVGVGLVEALAVGYDLHIVAQGGGVAHRVADGGDHRPEAAFGGGDPDGEVDDSHVARRYLHGLGARTQGFEPLLLLEGQGHLLARFQVVVDRHRHRNLVVLGQGQGQVDVDKEILKDADRRGGRAQPPVLGAGQGGQPPGGDGVRQVQVGLPATLGVGHGVGVPIHRLGEELAQEWGFLCRRARSLGGGALDAGCVLGYDRGHRRHRRFHLGQDLLHKDGLAGHQIDASLGWEGVHGRGACQRRYGQDGDGDRQQGEQGDKAGAGQGPAVTLEAKPGRSRAKGQRQGQVAGHKADDGRRRRFLLARQHQGCEKDGQQNAVCNQQQQCQACADLALAHGTYGQAGSAG